MKILITSCFLLLFAFGTAKAVAPEPQETQVVVSTHKPMTPQEIVAVKSKEYGVSEAVMRDIIECESGWNTTLQSRHVYTFSRPERGIYAGNREMSYGLVQIHLPDHPNVTYEQAIDPTFAVEFLAKHIRDGNLWMWTCAKIRGHA